MLGDLVLRDRAWPEALVTPMGTMSAQALRDRVQDAVHQLYPLSARRVIVDCQPVPAVFAALAALDCIGAETVLADEDLLVSHRGLVDALSPAAVVRPAAGDRLDVEALGAAATASQPGVLLLTSGTTGQPKPVRHTWQSLAGDARPQSPGARWASAYRLRLFASLQVLVQAWTSGGVFIAGLPAQSGDAADYWARAGAEFASGTPSFWRRLVLAVDRATLARIPLRQITLGGEPADQPLLDSLRAVFPAARLTHIYATTELGRCLAVSDGLAGFPAALLTQPPAGCELRVEDGELFVRRVDRGAAAAWVGTGDLVHPRDGRVYFAGRRDDMLNVGGQKVFPAEVERTLRDVPGVADVRVFGRQSALVGALVACEVVAAAGHEEADVRRSLEAHASAHLSPAQQPRFVEFVKVITTSSAGKVLRSMPGER